MNAREQILADVRLALKRTTDAPVLPIPGSARIAPRVPGDANAEIEMLLGEITKLGGATRRISRAEMRAALAQIARDDAVKKATLWETQELKAWDIADALRDLGIEIISPHADKRALAECDLGITGADAAFPETGTLLLRSSPEKPRAVSLLPRVHLAIITPEILRADLAPAFAEVKGEGYWVFVTGPSRTADIELTVTIGVHGPKALRVWVMDGGS
ncbi:MAG: LUD domain-containing protein [Chloroflexi bacterium]|nr:LUD domain-containing protein [Chloroflexota bacterium]